MGNKCPLSSPKSEYAPIFGPVLSAYQRISFMECLGDEWFKTKDLQR